MSDVTKMDPGEKIAETMRRSLPLLPADSRAVVESMLTKENFAIVIGTLVVWGGSHFAGVGEIVDVLLLVGGLVALRFSVADSSPKCNKVA
jgi:hypothetical protein